ncbi:MAG: GGDEF domain-containing response regulator [Deltaproteobacteria bacterium]|nr:GGDEF domain-containing response regulator [Deltaproteobacteria bacterium]
MSDASLPGQALGVDAHHIARRATPSWGEPGRVLLVEDNPGDAMLVIDHLTELPGMTIEQATSVAEAMVALAHRAFDFVITDLTLPDAHGLEAIRRLQPAAPGVTLIVLSGLDDEELAMEALQCGAQDYLVKGQVDAPTLRRTLRHGRERKQASNRLLHLTRHDPLTGAANRVALRERIEATLGSRRNLACAVLFIDLDRFKAINDTCGHDAGDAVLCEVSNRLHELVRSSDVVARLGGDEFAVFLDDLDRTSRPTEVAERIVRALARPIVVGDRHLVVTASVGVACYPEVAGAVDDLLKAADSAMYVAKSCGRDNVQVFGASSAAAQARLDLGSELQHALERGELSLEFQPQFTIEGRRMVALEALLRWRRGNGAQVPPTEFVPLLEDNGRIVAVGAWVIERACAQLAEWHARGHRHLRMAVNLSARQIERPGLVECVRRSLAQFHVAPRSLELEITESMLMTDVPRTTAVLGELRAMGVRLAIDDFGTGYSSLSYLTRFAVDCLKIDRSFIDNVTADGERATVTQAIVTLGHHLGLEVLAEGVETAEQLAFLSSLRCDLAQGYLLGYPAPAASVLVTPDEPGAAPTDLVNTRRMRICR